MRSTLEIIIAVQECQPVTEEELKLALMALSGIEHFVEHALRDLIEAVETDKSSAKMRAGFAKETLERMFYARKKGPDEWLGPNNIPGSPEQNERLAEAKAIYKKATGEEL